MEKLLDWFRNYIITNKAVFLTWGLVLSHSLAEYAVVFVLIDFLAEKYSSLSLRKAAMVVNLIDGGSALFLVIVSHVSEAWTGRLIMICVCTAAYVAGLLILLYVTDYFLPFNLLYLALGLVALGRGGKEPASQSFIEFQLRKNMKQSTESFDGEVHVNVWWKTAWISGAAIAIFVRGLATWQLTFFVCGTVMGVSYLFFLIGVKYYHKETPKGSPLTIIYRVFKAALLKLNLEYPTSAEKYYLKDERPNALYRNKAGELHLLPHVPFPFRFLDKAAILREASNISPQMQETKGKLRAVKEVKEVERLMPVVYLGLCFYAYSLVVASGNTYFVVQASNLNGKIGSFNISVSFLFVLKSFVRDVVIFSFWWFKLSEQCDTICRIGAGMFCAVLCCITAWQVEVHRLSLIKSEGVLQDPEKILSLSILVLIPQYFLLGLMEGLAERGLGELFYNYVPESMRNFEQPFVGFVLSVGKFLSIPYALIFGSWFKETINTSRLDKYFLVLAIQSFVFLCIYLIFLCCSSGYNFTEKCQENEATMEQTQEAIHDTIREELGSSQEISILEVETDTSQVSWADGCLTQCLIPYFTTY